MNAVVVTEKEHGTNALILPAPKCAPTFDLGLISFFTPDPKDNTLISTVGMIFFHHSRLKRSS